MCYRALLPHNERSEGPAKRRFFSGEVRSTGVVQRGACLSGIFLASAIFSDPRACQAFGETWWQVIGVERG